jgi:hypothetical protein
MNKLKVLKIVVVLNALFIISSCRHEPVLLPDTQAVCFQDQILPVINSNCAVSGCHDASSEESLNNYNNIMKFITPGKPNQSKIYKLITTTSVFSEFMPPSPSNPLTQDQIDAISIWILQGAENNTCPEPPCDTSNVSFSGFVFPIIQDNCYGCHSGSNPEGGIFLTNYDQVKTQGTIPEGSTGSLLGSITWAYGNYQMPKNSNPLSDCKIAQIEIWIQEGMPNN